METNEEEYLYYPTAESEDKYMHKFYKDLKFKHPDENVRQAAGNCLKLSRTDQWKSRTMRVYLCELSHALHRYLKSDEVIK